MSKLFKNKIINFIMFKGQKFTSEKLLKKTLKLLLKNNKKNLNSLLYLAINQGLYTFKLETKTIKIKKQNWVKNKPIFVTNKNRIFFALKLIISFSRNLNLKSNFFIKLKDQFFSLILKSSSHSIIVEKINIQNKLLTYQNILFFYRF